MESDTVNMSVNVYKPGIDVRVSVPFEEET